MDLTRRQLLSLAPALVAGRRLPSASEGARVSATTPDLSEVAVIERSAWGARAPTGPYLNHSLARMTVHHTAGAVRDASAAPAAIRGWQRFHQHDRGWVDLAYHFMIDPDGNVYESRPFDTAGDTATSYDPLGHLLPCLTGDYRTQVPTAAQLDSLVALLAWAAGTHDLDPGGIGGHRDYAGTSCPGDNVYNLLPELRLRVAQQVASGGTRLRYLRGEEATQRIAEIEGHPAVPRWSGANRYATAATIAQHTHPTGADTVFVATGTNYPDALGAGPAAAATGAPLLLVTPTTIPPPTISELRRLQPDRIIVIGGDGVIAPQVETQLGVLASQVDRLAGADRYATAATIAQHTHPTGADTVFVATGTNYPDALGAGPAAAATGAPLLLVTPTTIPPPTISELRRLQPDRIIVIGGHGVIGSDLPAELNQFVAV